MEWADKDKFPSPAYERHDCTGEHKMKLTCLCMYHGRNWCLPEAVESYLRQLPAIGVETELLILSDIPEQTVICDLPTVRVVNVPRYPDMALKQNDGVRMAEGDWVLLWDDDDICLPWRVQVMAQCMAFFPTARALATSRAWYSETDVLLNIASNLFAGSMLVERDFYLVCGGSPLGVRGADRGAWFAFPPEMTQRVAHADADIPYIYRWDRTFAHDSGLLEQWPHNATLRSNAFHSRIVGDLRFRPGEWRVEPQWKRDYVADVRAALREGRETI